MPTASAGAAPVTTVESEAALDELVRALLDPQRQRPVVVVSVPSSRDEPYIDTKAIAAEAGGRADVYVVGTGPLTFRMADALTPMACVYGGAGRLYAPGTAWLEDPYQSRLRFARDAAEGADATEDLIGDVLGAVFSRTAGRPATAETASRTTTGRVSALVPPSRALVVLEDGQPATIWSDRVEPGLPIDRLVTVGMAVDGRFELDTRRLDVTGMQVSSETALADCDPGAVVLARVAHVQPDRVDVELFPGVRSVLGAAEVTANERDDLTELMSCGEAVAVRVLDRPSPQSGEWRLTMVDIDDDEPLRASPSVLRGGPPWLALASPGAQVPAATAVTGPSTAPHAALASPTPPAPSVAAPASPTLLAPSVAAPAPALAPPSVPTSEVAALRGQVQALAEENGLLEAQRRDCLTKIDALRAEVERLRTRVREAKTRSRRAAPSPPVSAGFADPEEQLRWDVQHTWVDRIPAAEKPGLPLRPYTVGPRFLDSLERVEGIGRERILSVVVDVLVGGPPSGTHPLRRSVGSDDRPVTRGDAVCLRAPLQTGTPSARRLHYWKGPDDDIELSRVVVHDDVDP